MPVDIITELFGKAPVIKPMIHPYPQTASDAEKIHFEKLFEKLSIDFVNQFPDTKDKMPQTA